MKNLPLLMALIAIFLFVGCASDAGGGEAPPTAVTLDFEGQDIAYDRVVATVSSGQQVTVNFNNVGALEHSWVLIANNVDPLQATQADALGGATSGDITGGESVSFTFTAPPPGVYQFVCTIEGHVAAGMVGTLTVE